MHEVLINLLGGLSLPRKSVIRLTDRPDMTLDVYRGRKTTMQLWLFNIILEQKKKEIENTMLVSFDMKFIRQVQKQHRNGEAWRASLICIWLSLINLITKDTGLSIYHALFNSRFNYTPGIRSMPWGYNVFVFSLSVCVCVCVC